jgi:branched-subunit amino acid aminotransferase/4-amino-4-deoxychorismate lyase
MSDYAILNGKLVREKDISISPNNRSFRYGDGCFETMKWIEGNLILENLHFRRFFSSLQILKFEVPAAVTATDLLAQIRLMVVENHHNHFARVRLTAYRGDGNLYENDGNRLNYLIQSFPGNPTSNVFNEKGFTLDFYYDAKKAIDLFSAVKSNNYLGYSMAAGWAKEKGLDDCIICNAYNRIADATIANVFIVQDGVIKTVPDIEGCVGGLMKEYLINCFVKEGISYKEEPLTPHDILNASEVFLTNANYGIRWVEKIQNSRYTNKVSSSLHQSFIVPLFKVSTFV